MIFPAAKCESWVGNALTLSICRLNLNSSLDFHIWLNPFCSFPAALERCTKLIKSAWSIPTVAVRVLVVSTPASPDELTVVHQYFHKGGSALQPCHLANRTANLCFVGYLKVSYSTLEYFRVYLSFKSILENWILEYLRVS